MLQCCDPRKDDIPGWSELRIWHKGHMNKSLKYQVFLSDLQSAHHAVDTKFNMEGNTISTSVSSGGNVKYAVKIKKHISLEEDPKAECKVYNGKGYPECLGKIQTIKSKINT